MRCVKHRHAAIAVLLTVWLIATGYGLRVLWQYSNTPGKQAAASAIWPADAAIPRTAGRWTLVMFNHPQCPCSRAGVGELAWIMTRAGGNLDARVFFYAPRGESPEWAQTDLWRSASEIPGVAIAVDRGGETAAQFGATTSGQALLYDATGRLVFKGGITAARGHLGDSAGRNAIVSLVRGDSLGSVTTGGIATPVFGCSLRDAS